MSASTARRSGGSGAPALGPVEELVSREFWDERNRRSLLDPIAPRPRKYYMDFELDRVFRRWLGSRRGRRLLEAGCGSSIWLPYFAVRFGMEVAGIDYSDVGLALSREILRLNGARGSLRKADIRDGPGRDRGAYDFVFSLGLIEHFVRPENVLALLKEYVRPGGLLLTWLPNTGGWIPRLNQVLDRHYRGFYARLDLASVCAHHRALDLDILQGSYIQFLDFNFLALTPFPGWLKKCLSLVFRGFGLVLMALEKALPRPIQSRHLCTGIIVVAKRPEIELK